MLPNHHSLLSIKNKASLLRILRSAGLFFSLLFMQSKAVAQLTGKVVDDKASPVPFVNIALVRTADSTLVRTTLTDVEGKFSLSAGEGLYILKVTAMGFGNQTIDSLTISLGEAQKDLGVIKLTPKAKAMKEVSVTSLRPTITQLPDRMIVNIEGTALALGNTAFEVLTKAPGVIVDQDGNITLNGRPGVTIMLDGKLTYLSAQDLKNMLEGMSADNIKNIEVITNPSSKYDAEGTAGILNINLKKNNRQGINGSVSANYSFNGKQHGYLTNATINHKSGDWSSFINIDMNRRVGGREATFTRIFYGTNNTTYFDQFATGNFVVQGPAVRFGTDYSINKKHSVGIVAYYGTTKGRSDFLTDTYIGNAPKQPLRYIDADNYNQSTYDNVTLNAHYNLKFDTLNSQFSIDVDYVNISNKRAANFYNIYKDLAVNTSTQDNLYTFLPGHYDIYSAKFDFIKNFVNRNKLEFGGKASSVESDNDSKFYFNNGPLVPDRQRTNHFNYREQIYAGYANWSGAISKKVTLQTGLRVEHTVSEGISYTTGQVTPRDYTDLFPSVFVQQKVSDNYNITYSYTRRLTRPNYGNLNPFRFYRDPYTWEQGNPYLRPQYTHALGINQIIKKVYSISFSYLEHRDVNAELPILNADSATTIYTTGNVDKGRYFGLTAVAPLRVMKGWDIQNTLTLSYNKLAMIVDKKEVVNDRVSYYYQMNHTIQLPKSLRLEVAYWYRSAVAGGLYTVHAMSRFDVALKKSFFKKKLDVGISGADIFAGQRFRFTTDINGNVNDFDQYFRFRAVGFNIRWNFSKGTKVEEKKRNALEEVNRT
jgi:hypothetical protein